MQEYLELERHSEVRHEYIDGELRAMAGETPEHNQIAGNIYRKFGNLFENRPCFAYIEGVRVRVTPTQYRYPDVVALCGNARFDAERPPALLNPGVIVEVLSPSTEAVDQDEKFEEYRQIDGVTDYVLISQDRVQVSHHVRQETGHWLVTEYTTLEDTVRFSGLEVEVTLTEIYRKIVFSAAPSI